MINILLCNVGQQPVVTRIDSRLTTMQKLVGGLIEFVDIGQGLSIVCNEDGIRLRLPQNRCGILGNFFFTKTGSHGRSVSLSDAEVTVAQLYAEVFKLIKHKTVDPEVKSFDTLDEMQAWLYSQRSETLN